MVTDEDTSLRCLRSLGIGMSPCLRLQTSRSAPSCFFLATSKNLPLSSPLAVVPESAVWTAHSVHDDDAEGLMPTQETCAALLSAMNASSLFDVFYLALYFSFAACRGTSLWSEWQLRQVSPHSVDSESGRTAAEFLRSLSHHSLTPPLHLFLSMTDYTLSHSCRLSSDGTQMQAGGPLLGVMPIVDVALSREGESNVSLRRCDASEVCRLTRTHSLFYAKHRQRRSPGAGNYWVLQTLKNIEKGERLTLQQGS